MAKSKGVFLTLQSLVDAGYDPLDYRYFLLGAHYRSQIQFSFEALDSARSSRKSLVERIIALKEKAGNALVPFGEKAAAHIETFAGHLCQDISTPRALAELWGLVQDNEVPPAQALSAVLRMDEVLGLGLGESRRAEAAPVERRARRRDRAPRGRARLGQEGEGLGPGGRDQGRAQEQGRPARGRSRRHCLEARMSRRPALS